MRSWCLFVLLSRGLLLVDTSFSLSRVGWTFPMYFLLLLQYNYHKLTVWKRVTPFDDFVEIQTYHTSWTLLKGGAQWRTLGVVHWCYNKYLFLGCIALDCSVGLHPQFCWLESVWPRAIFVFFLACHFLIHLASMDK